MIVLSSDVTVKDLLDKRSAIYSDRPDMFIGQKIASGDMRLVVMVRYLGSASRISAATMFCTSDLPFIPSPSYDIVRTVARC